ncbi:Copper transport protein ctr4 [Fusarium odoratissimum]|uniref:Copper transport protein n=1 Tax=Fusarium oxysporum f. sp. cubense (strain race 4) TaxID=2502994 RepID=N1R822_FUSC4|nr:Copper transport protein ctr4 [Fusarium odoratissimum]
MDHDIAATATMHPAFATALASLSEEGAGNCTENPMLWNWNTIGTCFISKAWYMDSGGKFGITCFGAFMLVMLLEFLARVSREWERHRFARGAPNSQGQYAPAADANDVNDANDANPIPNFCPSFVEHAFIKALLHTVQCIITYILILMAVSFNGYIIISMFIGAYVGALCFQRDPLTETRNPNAYQRAFQQPVVCCV